MDPSDPADSGRAYTIGGAPPVGSTGIVSRYWSGDAAAHADLGVRHASRLPAESGSDEYAVVVRLQSHGRRGREFQANRDPWSAPGYGVTSTCGADRRGVSAAGVSFFQVS